MRKYKDIAVAGNCGCCVVPFVLLVVIVALALVTSVLVWHTATLNVFDWAGLRQQHSDAYRAGFQEGRRIGAEYAARGESEPSDRDLNTLALREADRSHVRRDRRRWTEGFRSGFARGFESFSKEVLNRPLMVSPVLTCAQPAIATLDGEMSATVLTHIRRQWA